MTLHLVIFETAFVVATILPLEASRATLQTVLVGPLEERAIRPGLLSITVLFAVGPITYVV